MPERLMTDEKDENMDVLLKLKKTRYNNLLLLYWEREVRGLKFLKKNPRMLGGCWTFYFVGV